MLYLNQLDYRGVPYRHNIKNGGVPPERQNVATSGCGLCSVCMIVDQLTVYSLSVPDCAALAEASGANWRVGCDMTILGPAAARRFDLEYGGTWDPYIAAAKEGLLYAYEDCQHAPYKSENFGIGEPYWFGIYSGYIGFICDMDALEEAGVEAPTCWADLA